MTSSPWLRLFPIVIASGWLSACAGPQPYAEARSAPPRSLSDRAGLGEFSGVSALARAARAFAPFFAWEFAGRGIRFGPETWEARYAGLEAPGNRVLGVMAKARGPRPGSRISNATRFRFWRQASYHGFEPVRGSSPRLRARRFADGRFSEVELAWDGAVARVLCRLPNSPTPAVEVSRGPEGFALTITNAEGQALLAVESRIAGASSFRVNLPGSEAESGSADSFLSLLIRHRAVFDATIFPVLQRFGLPRPELPVDRDRVREVHRCLRASLVDTKSWPRHLKALSSEQFARREEALLALAFDYMSFEELIEAALEDRAQSPGVRFYLAFLKERYGGPAKRTRERIHRSGLLENADYRELLIRRSGAHEREDLRRILALRRREAAGKKKGY